MVELPASSMTSSFTTRLPLSEPAALRTTSLTLPVLLAAAFMELMDVSILNIALPRLSRGLHATGPELQWIIAGYSMLFATVLITAARLGDLHGRRRAFQWGMVLFMMASAGCGLSPNATVLIVMRMLQGLGGGVMMPQILSIIQVEFPGGERLRALAMYGAAGGLATVIGPFIGALLIRLDPLGSGWRSIFFVNVIIGIAALGLTWSAVPESRSRSPLSLDIPGMLLLGGAAVSLFAPFIAAGNGTWTAADSAAACTGGMLLVALLVYEYRAGSRGRTPVLDLTLFGIRSFRWGILASFLFFSTIAAFFLAATIYLQVALRFSVLHAGLTGLPYSIGIVIGASAASALGARLQRKLLVAGALGMAGSMILLSWTVQAAGSHATSFDFVPGLLLGGVSMGCLVVLLIDFVLADIPQDRAGAASGIANLMQPVGGAAGIAVIGGLFFGIHADGAPYRSAFTAVLAVEAGVLLLVAASLFLLPSRIQDHDLPEGSPPEFTPDS